MTEHRNPSDEQLASYLLGELSDEQRRDFESGLSADAAGDAEALGKLVTRLEAVDADAWNPVEPPPLKLPPEAALETPPTVETATPEREGFFQRLFGGSFSVQPALASLFVVLVFAGGLGIGILFAGDVDEDANPVVVTREAQLQTVGTLDPSADGDAQVDESNQRIRIRVNGLAANSGGDFYEAWLMDADQGLVSLGSFRVGEDGSADIDVPVPVNVDEFPVVDISLEPADGAPAHSGESVLRGDIS